MYGRNSDVEANPSRLNSLIRIARVSCITIRQNMVSGGKISSGVGVGTLRLGSLSL